MHTGNHGRRTVPCRARHGWVRGRMRARGGRQGSGGPHVRTYSSGVL